VRVTQQQKTRLPIPMHTCIPLQRHTALSFLSYCHTICRPVMLHRTTLPARRCLVHTHSGYVYVAPRYHCNDMLAADTPRWATPPSLQIHPKLGSPAWSLNKHRPLYSVASARHPSSSHACISVIYPPCFTLKQAAVCQSKSFCPLQQHSKRSSPHRTPPTDALCRVYEVQHLVTA
jgi:hypothetical protein